MAVPVEKRVTVRCTKKRQKIEDYECITHISSGDKEMTQPLTVVRWKKLVVCARKWIEIDGIGRTLAEVVRQHDDDFASGTKDNSTPNPAGSDEDLSQFLDTKRLGFHPTCYRRFIDKKRITSAEKMAEKRKACGSGVGGDDDKGVDHEASSTSSVVPLPPKRLRSRAEMTIKSSKSSVLPAVCIICKKIDCVIKVAHKTKKDKLVQAETITAGSLVRAAELKADESILMYTRGKDCVAIEVRYHKRCYKVYTNFLTSRKSDERLPKVWEYDEAYKAFCLNFIQARLIEQQEIFRMKNVSAVFHKFIREHHGHGNYRSDLLKKRLQQDFPQLNFCKPSRKNQSEMVFTETSGLLDHGGSPIETTDPEETSSSCGEIDAQEKANAEDHITSLTGTHEETAKEQHGVHLSKWLLRSSISDAQVQHLPSRKHILPVHCVICGRVKYTREKLSRKRIREPLVRCANVHGGQLLKAATIRQDERLLHDIQERDLEAVEVKYHHSCYRRYTTCKLKANALSAPREYKQSFQKFYDEIIQEKLIQGKEVWPLSELNKVFIQMIKEVEGVDAKGYKSGRLKKRIQKSNPCICFCRPLHLSKSDIVFVGDLTVQNVVQDAVGQMSMVQSKRTSNPSDRGQNCSTVSEARSNMFLTATTSEATIPSAKHSLQKHPGRADYQAAIHRQSFKQDHQVHSPDGHGQEIIHDLEASRKAHLPLPDYVLDLINCSCKKTNCEPLVSGVKGGCSCRTYNVRCTDMCTCVGCGNSVPTESLKR